MLEMLTNALRLPDLRKRILFVFAMFGVFVLGVHIPVPGIDHDALENLFAQGGGILGMVDLFSGGALRKYSVLAMGIMPYITASIMMQLLVVAIPSLEQMQKEGGEAGRKKISQYIRYLTVVLAFFQAFGMSMTLQKMGIFAGSGFTLFQVVISQVAGTCFLMWLGELMTDKGIGNGVSLIIFCGIVNRLPMYAKQTWLLMQAGTLSVFQVLFFVALFIGTIVFVVAITQAQRKIPIQRAQRVVGNKMMSGGMSFLPLRVNSAGVIPIIFALAIVMIPTTILQFVPEGNLLAPAVTFMVKILTPGTGGTTGGSAWGLVVYAGMVVAFTYFYTSVTLNIQDMADNLKKWGNSIPGIRPGRPTMEYLDRVMSRITLAGAVFLAVVAALQYLVPEWTKVTTFTGIVGGTSLLIVVGVALETMKQIEAHLLMRHYEGFIK